LAGIEPGGSTGEGIGEERGGGDGRGGLNVLLGRLSNWETAEEKRYAEREGERGNQKRACERGQLGRAKTSANCVVKEVVREIEAPAPAVGENTQNRRRVAKKRASEVGEERCGERWEGDAAQEWPISEESWKSAAPTSKRRVAPGRTIALSKALRRLIETVDSRLKGICPGGVSKGLGLERFYPEA